MKYIITKDLGIYTFYDDVDVNKYVNIKDNILKQADTPEELCDGFAYWDTNAIPKPCYRKEESLRFLLDRYDILIDESAPCNKYQSYYKEEENFVEIAKGLWLDTDKVKNGVYGGIWVKDEGFIFIMKMNEKMEMELLK